MKLLSITFTLLASISVFAQAPKLSKPKLETIVERCGYNKTIITGIGNKKETLNIKVGLYKDLTYNYTQVMRWTQKPGEKTWTHVSVEKFKGIVTDKTKAIQRKLKEGNFENDVISFVANPANWSIEGNPNALRSLSFYTYANDRNGRSILISEQTFDSVCK